ncbi:MAG: GMC family oxidoreductase N-terminal domain-containing protein [Acidobacteriota bacterium]|nr:GMC family oxidoreductase N-terminal domain-containing protein [Acidobacteriota bacterium]
MKTAVIVGSGAGGATAAKELQGYFDVTVLEAGKEFRPFAMNLKTAARLKKTRLISRVKDIEVIFPAMTIRETDDGMVLVSGRGTGGTTTLSTGNAMRMDHGLAKLGIRLDSEFEELASEVPITADHQRLWRPATQRLYQICREMGLDPAPTPKMGAYERCAICGHCILGCDYGVKWDSRRFLEIALEKGAQIVTRARVERIAIENGRATGVEARIKGRRRFVRADVVILAAGGLGTPVILQNSGIPCEPRLFVDPVLCLAGEWKGAFQNREMPMPFVVQMDRYIISPYFDHLSFFFNKKWKYPAENILSLMIKLADSNAGSVTSTRLDKTLTAEDRRRLNQAMKLCTGILQRAGIECFNIFTGTVNAGHPGGMLPLTAGDAESLHPEKLPENVYLSDSTLFPESMGNPPILTIMALAKRVAGVCRRTLA